MVSRPADEEESINLLVALGLPSDIIEDTIKSAREHNCLPHEFVASSYQQAMDRITVRRLLPLETPRVVDRRHAASTVPMVAASLSILKKSFARAGKANLA